jgi:hypothetical protein
MITARKTYRALSAMLPAWMLAVFAVCLVIPGPFDEIAIIVTAVFMGIVQPIRFRRAYSAWMGGKSHRMYDLAA